jgi:hypothetical protein
MMLANYENNNNSERDALLLQAHYPTNHTDAELHKIFGGIFGACFGDRNKKNTIDRRGQTHHVSSSNKDKHPQVVNPTITGIPSRRLLPPPSGAVNYKPPPLVEVNDVINEPLHIVILFVDREGHEQVAIEEYNWDLGSVKFPYRQRSEVELNLRDVESELGGSIARVFYEKLLRDETSGKQFLAIKYDVRNRTNAEFLKLLEKCFRVAVLTDISLRSIKYIFYGGNPRDVKFKDITKQMFEQVILSEKPASLLVQKTSGLFKGNKN